MTEIAIPASQGAEMQAYQDATLVRLQTWAQQADVIYKMANTVVGTAMCPKAYRNKPDEAAAAMLAGLEMGLGPMASLRAFDDISGTPAPKAITLRAVVQSRGHDLEIVESGPTKAVAEGRRKGSDRWQRVEWTIERATQAGYVAKNPRWKADPTAQLVARATAEMARWLDSAAIMGMPYSAEEISDATGIEARPVTKAVTAADFVTAAVDHQTTVEAITADEALARIKVAEDEDDLNEVRRLCEQAGLNDERVFAAWKVRLVEVMPA
jgi:hypothetical protein